MTNHIPITVGELRRRLGELGDPWQVDPGLSDDEPLSDPPRGATFDESEAVATMTADLRALLAEEPPSNPYLRRRWADEGLLAQDAVGQGADEEGRP
jgi:hypothetical protein